MAAKEYLLSFAVICFHKSLKRQLEMKEIEKKHALKRKFLHFYKQ